MSRLERWIGLTAMAGLIALAIEVPAAHAQRVQTGGTMVGPGTSAGFFPFFRVVPSQATLQQAANIAALGRAFSFVPPYSPLVNGGRGFNPFTPFRTFPNGPIPTIPLLPPRPPFYNPYLTGGYNPYLLANPYWLTNPYLASNPYSNDMPSMTSTAVLPTSTGYGGSSQGYAPGQTALSTAPTDSPATSTELAKVLAASGLPTEHDQLQWPVGLRNLGAPEADGLRQQIDALLQLAVPEKAGRRAEPERLEELTRAVNRFRLVLLKDKEERFGMPLAVYDEAEQFLDRLRKVPKVLPTASTPSRTATDKPSR